MLFVVIAASRPVNKNVRRCYKSKTRYRLQSRAFINYWRTIKPVVTNLQV